MESLVPIYTALEDAEVRGEMIRCLLSLERACRSKCGPILRDLHNSGRISLTSDITLTAIEALSNNDFWSVIHILDQAIPELDCSHRDVLKLVNTLVKKGGADGAASMPNLSLVKWCKANPEKARLIFEGAKSLDELSLSHCVFAIQALEDVELSFELLGHSKKNVVAVGLCSLGRLQIDTEAIANRVIDECCEVIANEEDSDVRSCAIEAACKTWGKFDSPDPYRQEELLKAIINANAGDELVQLSAALFHHSKVFTAENIDQILDSLSGNVSNPQSVLYWLDSALYSNGRSWSLTKVIDVIAKQIPRLENSIGPNELSNFCGIISENSEYLSYLFSRWLTSGQYELCQFLTSMAGEGGKKDMVVEISRANLPDELVDQIFMARKCVGFLWFYEITAASILLSIVKNGKKAARQEAEKLLYNPLLLSYSGNLRNFLEKQAKSQSQRIIDCIDRLTKSHDVYLAGLKQTEHLVEFVPTIEQRRAASMKDRVRNADIQKQAHDRSIFSQLASQQTLLYGNKTFTVAQGRDGNKFPSITPLSEFSYSAEYPRLCVIDSIGFAEMIKIFRVETKVLK